jgi:intracellular sulfur oxidation DsrE/DsrF family protein
LRKYGDDIELVVAAFGPGLNLLAINPARPISPLHQERVKSLMAYGVRFQACGNTMKSMGWQEIDLIDGPEIVPIGVDSIMQLQEQGFSYISI